MNTSRLSAGARNFAHLAGFSRKAKGAADDDQRDDDHRDEDDDADDDDQAKKGKRSKVSDDDKDEAEPKGKKSKASDDDQDDDSPKSKRSKAADDDQDDDDDAPKGKKSRASDDDDDCEDDDEKEEMNGRSAKASARRREQSRIGAILGHAAAANNLPLAVSLAVETRMTRSEAIAVLKGQSDRQHDDDDAPNNRHARADRSNRNVRLGGDPPAPNDKKAIASSWDAAFERAGVVAKRP